MLLSQSISIDIEGFEKKIFEVSHLCVLVSYFLYEDKDLYLTISPLEDLTKEPSG